MDQHPLSFIMERMNQHQQQKPKKPLPMMEAQRDHLRHVMTEVGATSRTAFQKGDFVRYVHSTGPLVKEAADGMVMMFWRWLDDCAEDQRRVAQVDHNFLLTLARLDCLLMIFDGEDTMFAMGGSEFLTIDDRLTKPVDSSNPE